MERKQFFATAAAVGASFAAAAVALAPAGRASGTQSSIDGNAPSSSNPPNTGNAYPQGPCQPRVRPLRSPLPPGQRPTPDPSKSLLHVDRQLGRMIELLSRDSSDYAGHKLKAIGYITQARAELDAALALAPPQTTTR